MAYDQVTKGMGALRQDAGAHVLVKAMANLIHLAVQRLPRADVELVFEYQIGQGDQQHHQHRAE